MPNGQRTPFDFINEALGINRIFRTRQQNAIRAQFSPFGVGRTPRQDPDQMGEIGESVVAITEGFGQPIVLPQGPKTPRQDLPAGIQPQVPVVPGLPAPGAFQQGGLQFAPALAPQIDIGPQIGLPVPGVPTGIPGRQGRAAGPQQRRPQQRSLDVRQRRLKARRSALQTRRSRIDQRRAEALGVRSLQNRTRS